MEAEGFFETVLPVYRTAWCCVHWRSCECNCLHRHCALYIPGAVQCWYYLWKLLYRYLQELAHIAEHMLLKLLVLFPTLLGNIYYHIHRVLCVSSMCMYVCMYVWKWKWWKHSFLSSWSNCGEIWFQIKIWHTNLAIEDTQAVLQ
jgi:hypothetical protein